MSDELVEREARTELMDALYQHAIAIHNLALNPMLTLPKYSLLKEELEGIEGRLMSMQADIGTLPFDS